MNDYKELIKQLVDATELLCEHKPAAAELFNKARMALEQLVKERDKAIAEINFAEPCCICKGREIDCIVCKFEWRGVTDE